MRRLWTLILACAVLGQAVWAQQRQKVTIIFPTRASQTWPLYIAKEGGYYEKYGFDVDLIFGVHPTAIAAIASDQAIMSPYTLEQSMQASFRDGSFIMLGQPYKKSSFAMMAAKNIPNIAALKGKRIAVSQLADAPYNYAVGLLAKAKLTPRDVQSVPVGAGAGARAAAVESGRAEATMLTAPEYYKLESEGFKNLANIASADDIYAPSMYLFKKSAVQGNDIAERMIKAHAEATKRFYDDKKFAVDAYVKWDPSQTRADIEKVWDEYSKMGAYERVPYILAPAVQYVLDHPADAQSAAAMKAYNWKQVMDNRVVDKLVKEKYFEQLFGPGVKAEQDRKAKQAFR
jgi:ABC-type nitrate/sulfonate/bicarbonate transport system substrate-binding protein